LSRYRGGSQQTAALNMNHNPAIMPESTLDGYFDDWGFDNVHYSTHAAGNWEMNIDEDWGTSWL
jgi:hypothetical protein